MPNETDDLEILRYALGELDGPARAAFEARLAREPALADATARSVAALTRFAGEVAPPEALSAVDQQRTLQHILASTRADPEPAPVVIYPRTGWRWAWRVAACLLLGLNVWQWQHGKWSERSSDRGGELSRETQSADSGTPPRATTTTQLAGSDGGPDASSALAARHLGAGAEAEGTVMPLRRGGEEVRRLREIQNEYARLERETAELRLEHDRLVHQLTQYASAGQGISRLAAMELVDAASYAEGRRHGLVDFAVNLLTEPGIVALDPNTPRPGDDGIGVGPRPSPGGEMGNAYTPPENPNPDVTLSTEAYAWALFDEAQQRGYLNVYNLPEPRASDALQLWVRPVVGSDYVRVGEVPAQYYGGSGSLYYTLPGSTQAPVELLITQEPRGAVPPQPTGPVIVRGP